MAQQHPQRTFAGKSYDAGVSPLFKYAADHSLRLQPIQKRLMEASRTELGRLAGMMGAPEVTQLLQNFIRNMKMKKVIEVGVFTGVSTLGFALALPEDGKVVGCDVSSEYPEIGRPFWKEAGVEHKIDIRIQPADLTLDELIAEGLANTFDLSFIDADKEGYDSYYEKCLQLIRPGGIIAFDNVLRGGTVLDENCTMPATEAIKALNVKLAKDERIDISFLVLGDGLTLAFKK